MTNATKALLIALVNAAMGLAVAFGVTVTVAQQGAITVFVNCALALVVALTYKGSEKRIPDGARVTYAPLGPTGPTGMTGAIGLDQNAGYTGLGPTGA